MTKIKNMIPFRTPDGTTWGVDVELPGFSNALVVFHHPDGSTSRKDRYAWYVWHGPESKDVTARLTLAQVRDRLDDRTVTDLFKRSMLIGSGRPAFAQA
ncbi:MAG: hypothetical protein ACR2M1_01955 [Gemmatimonadaceae bacterium]